MTKNEKLLRAAKAKADEPARKAFSKALKLSFKREKINQLTLSR